MILHSAQVVPKGQICERRALDEEDKMRGIVFTEFLEMVEDRFSPEMADDLIDSSDLPSGGVYTALGTYDHQEILTLTSALSERTETPVPTLLTVFGQHLFGRFVVLYPHVVDGIDSVFDFLKKLDAYIHVEVRKLYPDAELPVFTYDDSTEGQLVMTYSSTRPFGDLAQGLIAGCIAHYGEDIGVERQDLPDDEMTRVRFTLTRR
jgi:hypothetical protein